MTTRFSAVLLLCATFAACESGHLLPERRQAVIVELAVSGPDNNPTEGFEVLLGWNQAGDAAPETSWICGLPSRAAAFDSFTAAAGTDTIERLYSLTDDLGPGAARGSRICLGAEVRADGFVADSVEQVVDRPTDDDVPVEVRLEAILVPASSAIGAP